MIPIEKREYKGIEYYGGDFCTGDLYIDKATQLCIKKMDISGASLLMLDPGSGALLSHLKNSFSEFAISNSMYHDYLACARTAELHEITLSNSIDDFYSAWSKNNADTVLFRMNKSSEYTLFCVERILTISQSGKLYVYGTNDEGAKSLVKKLKKIGVQALCLEIGSSSRIFEIDIESNKKTVKASPRFIELSHSINGRDIVYANCPGVFSLKKLDEGSKLLIEALPNLSGMSVLDLGCGAGVLALSAAQKGAKSLFCADVNAISVYCTEQNLKSVKVKSTTQCTFMTDGINEMFDVVITNPPFHMGKNTHFDVGERWLKGCFEVLKPGGCIYLVANEFLKYLDFCNKLGFKVEKLCNSPRFFVYKIVS